MKTPLVKLLAIAAVVVAVISALKRRPAPPSASPTAPPNRPGPTAAPVVPKETVDAVDEPAPAQSTAATTVASAPWADPTNDGGCPDGYPVKAKLKSKIFHVEGGVLYERTVPDRCYASSAAAEADGLRQSLR